MKSNLIKAVDLFGDSIFDNAVYVGGYDNSVSAHLKRIGPMDVRLNAVDGFITDEVTRKMEREFHTKYGRANGGIVSVGGNDALSIVDEFMTPVISVLDAFNRIHPHLVRFEASYERMLKKMLEHIELENLRVCTIYDSIPVSRSGYLTESMLMGLNLFNGVITKLADRYKVTVLDLRNICTEDSDYSEASPIEPSSSGGLKIARAINATFGHVDRD